MLGGVLAECVAPRLMSRFGDRAVLGVGLFVLGGGALLLVPAVGVTAAVLVCGLRGLGFGCAVVVTGALVARHAPAERRGEGLALAGVVACVPAVAALPAGVWLADAAGAEAVCVVAAAVALAGGLAPLALGASSGSVEQATGLLAVARAPAQLRPALLFAATTVAGGIVVAYLPLAAGGPVVALGLFVQALTATAGRYGAGRWGDRHGHGRLVGPGLAGSGLGMVLLLGIDQPVVVIAAMAVFGIGFGVAQSATYAVMVEAAPAGGHGAVSALWNLAYDIGYGIGPLAFAAVVGTSGYPMAFAFTGLVVLAGLRAARQIR
jgi:MFS family permease